MKHLVWRATTIVSFFFFCVFAPAFAGNWNAKPVELAHLVQPIPIEGLTGVGINSMVLWSGASKARTVDQIVSHLAPLEGHGFSHVVLVSCADWIIGLPCKKGVSREHIVAVVNAVAEQTNLHVVLSLKAYEQKKISGKSTSTLQTKLESEETTQQSFVETWAYLAESLKHIDRNRLSFNLLNEPEFELPELSSSKRDQWLAIASKAIEGIREVSPDRVVILEGVGKSLFANRRKSEYRYRSVTNLVKPLPYADVVYGFHNYEPEQFLQQAKYRSGVVGQPHTKAVTKAVKADAARLIEWANANTVPVILSETGCIGYVDGKTEGPKNPEDCGLFARDIYDAYVANGVPVTWWALEKEKTIYLRDGPGDKDWMPSERIPDKGIFSGFRLNQ